MKSLARRPRSMTAGRQHPNLKVVKDQNLNSVDTYLAIPKLLRRRSQWVVWKEKKRKGAKLGDKPTKVPCQTDGRMASSTDPSTWATFEKAVASLRSGEFDGIGFVFSIDDPYCGIDLDHCIENGRLLPWAEDIVTQLDSYTELSPSGKGLHIIVAAKKPGTRCRKALGSGEIEIYDRGRYFTFTGTRWKNNLRPIKKAQTAVDAIYKKVFRNAQKPTRKLAPKSRPTKVDMMKKDILALAGRARNKNKFKRLWAGDSGGYPSTSEADLALCGILAFYTGGDPALLASLYRESGLAQIPKNKTSRRGNLTEYVDRLVRRAIEGCTDYYDWEGNNKKASSKIKPRPKGWTASELLKQEFPEPRLAIPGLLPEGLALLVGPPKAGKSWWAMNACTATVTGGDAFSAYQVPQGGALYLALEDSPQRLKQRLKNSLNSIDESSAALDQLYLFNRWPRVGEGGRTRLAQFLEEHQNIRLVFIDTLAKVRAYRQGKGSEYSYKRDYEAMASLKALAEEHRIALVLIHHTRKAEAKDVFSEIAGTTGLSGGADTLMVFKRLRGGSDAELWVTGRDIEEQHLALRFDSTNCSWVILGAAEICNTTNKQQRIIDALKDAYPETLSPKELVHITGREKNALQNALYHMERKGLIAKIDRGKYSYIELTNLSNKSTESNKATDVRNHPSVFQVKEPNNTSVIRNLRSNRGSGYERYQASMNAMQRRLKEKG